MATVIVAIILPLIVHSLFDEGLKRFIVVGFTCVISVGISAMMIGLTKHERVFLLDKGLQFIKKEYDKYTRK